MKTFKKTINDLCVIMVGIIGNHKPAKMNVEPESKPNFPYPVPSTEFAGFENLEKKIDDDFLKSDITGKDSTAEGINEPEVQLTIQDSKIPEEPVLPEEINSAPEISEPDKNAVLLENKPFVKLTEECVSIIAEFEGYIGRLDDGQAKEMVELFIERVKESLERAGLTRIDDDKTFNILRHIPVPMKRIPEGAAISGIIEPGLCIGNRVFQKAKVTVNWSPGDDVR